jgi:hypothetical protein
MKLGYFFIERGESPRKQESLEEEEAEEKGEEDKEETNSHKRHFKKEIRLMIY